MYKYIYIHMYIFIHIHTHVYIYRCLDIYIYMYPHICTFIHYMFVSILYVWQFLAGVKGKEYCGVAQIVRGVLHQRPGGPLGPGP